jgi:hypothetical protein
VAAVAEKQFITLAAGVKDWPEQSVLGILMLTFGMVLTVITCVAIADAQAAAGAVVINPTVYTPGLLKVN